MRAALDAFRSGRFDEATTHLRALEGKSEPIEDYRLFYLAEALLLDNRPLDAVTVYDELARHPKSRFAPLVPWRKADALLVAGEAGAAASAYAAGASSGIPGVVDSASVHLNWAMALEQDGRTEAARKRYEIVMRQFPHRPQADQAIEALGRLEAGYAVSTADRLERADRLSDMKRFAEAEKELRAIEEKLPKPQAREVTFKLATYVFQKRQAWTEAQSLFEPLARGNDAIAAESAYMVARCLHKRGQTTRAVSAYRKFLARFKGSSLRDDTLMNLMVIDYEAGRWALVRKANLPRLRAGTWTGDSRASALWMIAFSAYLEGDAQDALSLMDEYEAQSTGSMSKARALYWGGVIRQAMGRDDEAADRYDRLCRRYPLHYYAILATRRLMDMGRQIQDVDELVGPPAKPAAGGCSGLPPVVAVLVELDMDYDARQEMGRLAPRIVKEHSTRPAELARIFSCAGAEKLLIRHAGSLVGDENEGSGTATRARWELIYPTPYMAEVEDLSKKGGVPPMLAMAIMRQESMFDPDVTSSVRAAGLMQLMPATGERVAAQLGVAWSEDILFDPSTNIRFGTHYLGGLVSRFPGNLPAAVGAYNGGPHNMKRWLSTHAPVAGDVFVELVPFAQTRNYIRRVLSSYARYTYIATGDWKEALDWIPREMTATLGEGPTY